MDTSETVALLYSASYGIQRLAWVFSQDRKLREIAGYSKSKLVEYSMENLEIGPSGLTLAKEHAAGSLTTGTLSSPEFDWLVPWWNADCSGQGCLYLLLQVEEDGTWSQWYPIEQWGGSQKSFSRKTDGLGSIETDTMVLQKTSNRFRLRLVLSSSRLDATALAGGQLLPVVPDPGIGNVILYRCGILTRNRKASRPPTRSHYLQESAFRVTPLSQMMEAEPIRGRICSPTCVTMALSSLGRNYPTSFVAADCYDYGEKIYGNWAFNVASLWRLGARARLDFFANVEQACSELFGGRILIASIKFQDGSLSGAPIKKTNGHLVLLTGIRKNADGSWKLMVNDPAADSPDGVTRLYDIVEFENAWAGVAYVVEGCR